MFQDRTKVEAEGTVGEEVEVPMNQGQRWAKAETGQFLS
jgi:hypothetical protein